MNNKTSDRSSRQIQFMKQHHRGAVIFLLGLLIALLVEIFLFNAPYWQSRQAHTQLVDSSSISLGSGLEPQSPSSDKQTPSFVIRNQQEAFIQYVGKEPINYLQLIPSDSTKDQVINFSVLEKTIEGVWYTRSGNAAIYGPSKDSQLLHVGSNYTCVRFLFLDPPGTPLPNFSLILNPRIPLTISGTRLMIMLLIALFLALLRPGSSLYRLKLTTGNRSQAWGLVALTVLQLLVIAAIGQLTVSNSKGTPFTGLYNRWEWIDYDLYGRLGDAILHGHLWLDLPVPEELKNLKNVYNPQARYDLIRNHQTQIFFDHVFYHGKYYSYFGVVPAILLFIPYQLVTHQWLPSQNAAILLGLIITVMITLCAVRFAKTFFPKTASYGMVVLVIICGNLAASYYSEVMLGYYYSIPPLSALAFTLGGLYCWMRAKDAMHKRPIRTVHSAGAAEPGHLQEQKGTRRFMHGRILGSRQTSSAFDSVKRLIFAGWTQSTTDEFPRIMSKVPHPGAHSRGIGSEATARSGGHHKSVSGPAAGSRSSSRKWLAAGSVCMALTLGCRPPFIVACLLAVPLFWKELAEDHLFLSKKGLPNVCALILPFILVFIPLLWYNYARFGSVWNFGQDYNLTVVNMTEPATTWWTVPQQLYYYFLQPPNIFATFPFVGSTTIRASVYYWAEPLSGGLFFTIPFLLILFVMHNILSVKAANCAAGQPLSASRMLAIRLSLRLSMIFCLAVTSLAVVLMAIEGHKAGIGFRYPTDVAYLLMIVAVFLLMVIDSIRIPLAEDPGAAPSAGHLQPFTQYSRLMVLFLLICICITIFIQFFSLITPFRASRNLITVNPMTYFELSRWFLFI